MSNDFLLPSSKKTEKLSVVIPTRNRPEPISVLLKAILNQTLLPAEIIIVDDSSEETTTKVVNGLQPYFQNKGVQVHYTRGKKKSSISAARNVGIEKAVGDIILFFDDDVVPDPQGLEQLINCYRRHPTASGVAGYFGLLLYPNIHFPNTLFSFFNSFKKIFSITYLEHSNKRVLSSGNITFPYGLKDDLNCDWLSGGFSSFKATVLKTFRYDEKLEKYSLWEDVDISYRINKNYPNSLYVTPFARGVHNASPIGRRSNSLLTYILVGYHIYFFKKNIDQTLVNKLSFFSSLFGTFIFRFINRDFKGAILFLKVCRYSLKNFNQLAVGHFPFLEW